MTEQEWLKCSDPKLLLAFLECKVSNRKLRLFACGIARSLWPHISQPHIRKSVEIAEQYADSMASNSHAQ